MRKHQRKRAKHLQFPPFMWRQPFCIPISSGLAGHVCTIFPQTCSPALEDKIPLYAPPYQSTCLHTYNINKVVAIDFLMAATGL